jgi:hypothetical protein
MIDRQKPSAFHAPGVPRPPRCGGHGTPGKEVYLLNWLMAVNHRSTEASSVVAGKTSLNIQKRVAGQDHLAEINESVPLGVGAIGIVTSLGVEKSLGGNALLR